MALGEAELLRIGDYVKGNLRTWLQEVAPDPVTNTQLLERIVRLEERFDGQDIRFEAMDKRFQAVDKRFEDLIHHMDRRFESTDKRIDTVKWLVIAGLTAAAIGITLLTVFGG